MRTALKIILGLVLLIAIATFCLWYYDHVGQKADLNFNSTVQHPAYSTDSPRILIDEAHQNFHTASGRYKPFAELLKNDGYIVDGSNRPFSSEVLHGTTVLIIANALGQGEHESRPAFTPEEETILVAWVKNGGALLLIADHAPFGAAAEHLAQQFGVTMYLRYARDDRFHDGWDNERLLFSRDNGLLNDGLITNGRNQSERVNRVVTFTGQSLSGPNESISLLRLDDEAYDWESRSVRYPAKGHSQALAFHYGRGRVVVVGEAALFSAQVDMLGLKFGMNRQGNDDRQFALNIVHWLSGLLQ
ncbi:MAG: DUF4350 domain-containing protein [Acidobacteria bacterium]|nr:DUF4350 domain-containing protein [Acidobacteriota bacterium]